LLDVCFAACAAHSLAAGTPCAPPAAAARYLRFCRHDHVIQENDLAKAPGATDSTLQALATIAARTASRVAGAAHLAESACAPGTAGSVDRCPTRSAGTARHRSRLVVEPLGGGAATAAAHAAVARSPCAASSGAASAPECGSGKGDCVAARPACPVVTATEEARTRISTPPGIAADL